MKKRVSIASGLLLATAATTSAAQGSPPASMEEMWKILQQQSKEIEALRQENSEMRQQLNRMDQGLTEVAVKTEQAAAKPAEDDASKSTFDIYGFAQADFIYDFKRVDPDWKESLRPSYIPTRGSPYGDDGETIFSVKQTRFGVKSSTPTAMGDLNTLFEFELYGTGSDAGQTTFRLRHAWGELGNVGAGQTWSLFMDENVFPNSIEYWGPPGMVFYRNIQLRYTFPLGDSGSRLAFALESEGTSTDPGEFRDLAPGFADNIQSRNEYPDLTAQWRVFNDYGQFQVAGILRRLGYETTGTPNNSPSDDLWGGGINLSTVFKPSSLLPVNDRDRIKLQAVYGEGIGFYMNDGGIDLAPDGDEADQVELLGLVAFYDHYWNDQWSTSIGYSMMDLDNTDQQLDDALSTGQYALANLLWTPVDNFLTGLEFQWGNREDNDGEDGDDYRIQFSLKYSFDKRL